MNREHTGEGTEADPWVHLNRAYLIANQVPNTAKTYDPYWEQFRNFALQNGRQALPASVPTVLMFARALAADGLSPGTVDVAMAAIARQHRLHNLPSPTTDHPDSKLVTSAKQIIARDAPPPKTKRPLQFTHILRMMRVMDLSSQLDTRDVFMFTVMFLGLLRQAEAVRLRTDDVWETSTPEGTAILCIWIAKSKNDQTGKGELVILEASTDPLKCPVLWYRRYLRLRGSHPSPFLLVPTRGENSGALGDQLPNSRLKVWMNKIGEDASDWSSHCCRHGGATAAAAMGIAERLLQAHGRWKSQCVRVYIHDSLEAKLSVSRAIGKSQE